jgi:CubicO group peptidase (beta-lactamase class C family)
MQAMLNAILRRRPTVGLGVGVVRHGRLETFAGHGVADIPSGRPITQDTAFRIASVTKTFTAVSVMQLWEQGLVDLDAPVGGYLTSYRLVPDDPNWRPVTLRHLLTHTAGLAEVAQLRGLVRPDFGESVDAGRPLPTPADFYGGALRVHAEPGTRFVYSNHAPTTLGQVVEDVSGLPLHRYVRDHILDPLDMTDSDLVRTEHVRTHLATGYEIRSRGVRPVTERDMVTVGAASMFSTPRDMGRYLAALLDGGGDAGGRILRPATLAMMFRPHFQPDPRLPGMGLGFFRRDVGGHPAVGHQGTHPGFHSQVLLAPDDATAVMMFTNGAHHPDLWLPSAAADVLGHLIAARPRPSGAHHPELWSDLCGWYRLPARMSDVRLRAVLGAGAQVFVRSGRLMVRFLTPVPALAAGLPLEPDDPDDPDLFRVDLPEGHLDPIRMAFGRDGSGRVERLTLDLMPVSLEKRSATRTHTPETGVPGATDHHDPTASRRVGRLASWLTSSART